MISANGGGGRFLASLRGAVQEDSVIEEGFAEQDLQRQARDIRHRQAERARDRGFTPVRPPLASPKAPPAA